MRNIGLSVGIAACVVLVLPVAAWGEGIAAGTDYWVTVPGNQPGGATTPFDPDGPGPAPPIIIPWKGVPFGAATGPADTAVERKHNLGDPLSPLDQTTGNIAIELVALQLVSIGPITIPGAGQYDVSASVDADPQTASPGTMQILTHTDLSWPNSPLGTWITLADFIANARFDFTPVGAAPPMSPLYDSLPLQMASPAPWQHQPDAGSIVVPSDPDGPGPLGETSNFFVPSDITIHMGPHPVTPGGGVAPEPGTLSLLALGGLAVMRRRRDR